MTSTTAAAAPTHLNLAVIGGDGIGPEVVAEAVKVLQAAAPEVGVSLSDYDLGARRWHATGETLPESVIAELRGHDAILLGAIGDPTVPSGVLDFVVVREGTEGPYVGNGGGLRVGTPAEIATEVSVNTRFGVERVVRDAFARAQARPRRHLTLVHKHNVLTHAGHLWRRTVEEVGAEFPDVETAYQHVDAATIFLTTDPGRFDVIVTDNLFGDIITDIAAAIAGGIGLAASGNINPAGTAPSMFEPVHGSAPDIAGQGKADPTAAILSAAMLLDHVGLPAAASRIEAATASDLAHRGDASRSTTAIGDAIAALL